MKHKSWIAAAGLAVTLTAAGCGPSQNSADVAKSAAASLSADPQFQQLSAELKANMVKDFKASHPITSMETAVQDTFPGSDAHNIVVYAVKTFKLSDRKAGPARDAWVHAVVTYALQQSAQGVPSGAASVPIPGVSASVPTPTPSSS